MSVDTKADKAQAGGWRETLTVIAHALILAFVVRYFFYQPFHIPSGSMKSTLLIGDYLFVSKMSYGYSKYSFPFGLNLFDGRIFAAEPKRGDVVVFRLPRDNSTDYIKRVIGLPGDEINVRGGVVFLNGKEIARRPVGEFANVECPVGYESCHNVHYSVYEETLPEGKKFRVLDLGPNEALDNVGPFKVPAGHYFMMGDNRDNSTDSRVSQALGVGFVPFENLIGRAEIVFFSAAVDEPNAFRLTSPWTWPFDIRWRRMFNIVR